MFTVTLKECSPYIESLKQKMQENDSRLEKHVKLKKDMKLEKVSVLSRLESEFAKVPFIDKPSVLEEGFTLEKESSRLKKRSRWEKLPEGAQDFMPKPSLGMENSSDEPTVKRKKDWAGMWIRVPKDSEESSLQGDDNCDS
jgi:hypothetical protein